MEHFTFYGIKHDRRWDHEKRKSKENELINVFDTTIPNGLNKDCYNRKERYTIMPYLPTNLIPQTIKCIRNDTKTAYTTDRNLKFMFHENKHRKQSFKTSDTIE